MTFTEKELAFIRLCPFAVRVFYHAPLSLKTLDTSSPERLTSREDILEVFVILQAFSVEKFIKLDDWMMGSFIRI